MRVHGDKRGGQPPSPPEKEKLGAAVEEVERLQKQVPISMKPIKAGYEDSPTGLLEEEGTGLLEEDSTGFLSEEKLETKAKKSNPPAPKRRKAASRLAKAFLLIALTAALVLVFYFLKLSYLGLSLDSVQAKIDGLYTSEERVDLRDFVSTSDIEGIVSNLVWVPEGDRSSAQARSIQNELDTLLLFVEDRETLSILEDPDYNLDSPTFLADLSTIRVTEYGASPLRTSVQSRVTALQGEYELYILLKQELYSITEYGEFDYSAYVYKTNAIKHTVNREFLLAKIDEISAKRDLSLSGDGDKAIFEAALREAENNLSKFLKGAEGISSRKVPFLAGFLRGAFGLG